MGRRRRICPGRTWCPLRRRGRLRRSARPSGCTSSSGRSSSDLQRWSLSPTVMAEASSRFLIRSPTTRQTPPSMQGRRAGPPSRHHARIQSSRITPGAPDDPDDRRDEKRLHRRLWSAAGSVPVIRDAQGLVRIGNGVAADAHDSGPGDGELTCVIERHRVEDAGAMRAAFEGELVHGSADYGRWPGALPSAIRPILLEGRDGYPLADRPAVLPVGTLVMPILTLLAQLDLGGSWGWWRERRSRES